MDSSLTQSQLVLIRSDVVNLLGQAGVVAASQGHNVRPKWLPIPKGLWSKVAHYMRNRVPLGTYPNVEPEQSVIIHLSKSYLDLSGGGRWTILFTLHFSYIHFSPSAPY